MLEMAALEAIVEASRGEGPADRAVELARQAWEAQREPTTFEQHVVRAALGKVLKKPLDLKFPSRSSASSWTTYVYETVTLAWLHWAMKGEREAVGLTERLHREEPDTTREPGGAVELLALTSWSQAIERLILGDVTGSKRLFERSIEVGSQIGSESNPTINWCYAASFFPR